MPGPRPRFGVGPADPTTAAAAATRSPSPCLSDCPSLPSSRGPPTPPPTIVRALPFPLLGTAPRLHPLLKPPTALAWDAAQQHPLGADMRRKHRMALSEPATQSKLQHLKLVCDGPLRWTVSVNLGAAAGAAAPNAPLVRYAPLLDEDEFDEDIEESYIAVEDVLAALYVALREPLEENEIAAFSHDRRTNIAATHQARAAAEENRAKRDHELARGPRRVDLLLSEERTRFAGLVEMPGARDVWVVKFA